MGKEKIEAFETFNFELEPIRGFPELRWTGKRPFTSTQYFPAQLKEEYGHSVKGWWNKIFWGDNLQVMSHLLREFRDKIDLIYLDPPFDSKADYKKSISLRTGSTESDYTSFEEKQYTDIWSSDNYIQFMYERIVLSRELLNDTGAIVLHCDPRQSSYLRVIMDEVFGPNKQLNEVSWVRTSAHNIGTKGYARSHDVLLVYGKTSEIKFHEQYIDYDEKQLARYKLDENNRLYKAENLTFSSKNKTRQFAWRGTKPPPNRSWGASLEQLETWWKEGRILTKADGAPRLDGLKIYLDETNGKPVSSVWTDIGRIGNTASERLDYPTQKPELLLDRIINSFSNYGDIVVDLFMGSGTTQAMAMKLGRRFIGADINLGAIETTIMRLNTARSEISAVDSQASLLKCDDNYICYTGFQLYNVNDYDLFRNPVEARELIRDALELHPLSQNLAFDGEKDGFLVKIMPVNRIATRQDLNEVIMNLDFTTFEKRRDQHPTKPVERIMLVCMGHEPELGEQLQLQAKPFDIEVQVVDILRDKSHLHFKRASDAKLAIEKGELVITGFYPMNLLQKLSMEKIDDWRQLAESIKIDWNYDGAVLSPVLIDNPKEGELVKGRYAIPKDAATIRVKITDLLSESWEGSISNG